jgi:hypothetical protein
MFRLRTSNFESAQTSNSEVLSENTIYELFKDETTRLIKRVYFQIKPKVDL